MVAYDLAGNKRLSKEKKKAAFHRSTGTRLGGTYTLSLPSSRISLLFCTNKNKNKAHITIFAS
jgi:hypothetical protein